MDSNPYRYIYFCIVFQKENLFGLFASSFSTLITHPNPMLFVCIHTHARKIPLGLRNSRWFNIYTKNLVYLTRKIRNRSKQIPGGLAQMVERTLCMREARGSMPLSSKRSFLPFFMHWLSSTLHDL